MHISWLSGAEEELASPSPPRGGEGRGEVGIPSGRRHLPHLPTPEPVLGPRSARTRGVWAPGGKRVRPTETANTAKIRCYGWLFFAVIPPPRLPKTQHFRGSGRSTGCYF